MGKLSPSRTEGASGAPTPGMRRMCSWLLPRLCILLSLLKAAPNVTASSVPRCGNVLHAVVVNRTYCTCKSGFKAVSGQQFFTFPYETCKDINECESPGIEIVLCGVNAKCRNNIGSFYCVCDKGYKLLSGGVQFRGPSNNTCQNASTSSGTSQGKKELQQLVETVGSQLNETVWKTGKREEIATRASDLLQRVERNALDIALRTPEQKVQKIQNSSVAAETRVVDHCPPGGQMFQLRAQMNSMDIKCSDIHHGDSPGPAAVAFIAYESLGGFINATFFEDRHRQDQIDLGSRVLSAAVGPGRTPALSGPVTLTFQRTKVAAAREICVYWDSSQDGGHWATNGCVVLRANASHVTCSSSHLSSFAVLMAFTPQAQEDDPVLTLVTRVGLGLSLLCLLLAAVTFVLCGAIQSTSTSIHLQLCLCLFLAHLLFLTAINRTEIKVLCSIIAGALHYLYLAAFTWMLLEGLHLFLSARNLMVANYTRTRRPVERLLLPVGYGVPALIVAVSASCRPDLYGTPDHCWLQQGLIWVFVGPAGVISCVNFLFFVSVLCILRKKLSSLNSEVSTIHNIRLLTLKATAQLFILGCSWSLGLVQSSRVMSYLFTVTSTLQGVFLFLVYCVLNHQVQRWVRGIVNLKSEGPSITLSGRVGTDSKPAEDK